jgi:hypothetical protein
VGIACGVIVDDELVIGFAPRDRLRRRNAPQGNTSQCRSVHQDRRLPATQVIVVFTYAMISGAVHLMPAVGS